ncbi:hypothetical protein ABVF61_00600 [Roseibium sp. HPY-6]|uniref:hypothetical protein n=1 Tax=Roseibium sp. HPY-6 TaxID=3229852 RepID=UPI00338EED57
MHRILSRKALSFTLFLIACSNAYAQDRDNKASVAMAKVAVKYGPHVVSQLRNQNPTLVMKSKLPPDQRSIVLEDTLRRYELSRSVNSSLQRPLDTLALGAELGSEVALAVVGPQAGVTVPVLLAGAAVSTTFELASERIETKAQKNMRELFKSREGSILRELGLTSLAEFHNKPEEAARVVRNGIRVMQDFQDRADDELLREISEDLMIQTLINTDEAQWNQTIVNSSDIDRIENDVESIQKELRDYKVEIDTRFGDIEQEYEVLSVDVETLKDAVLELDAKIQVLERDQSVISDFVLSRMSPKEKIRAIEKQGFLADQFKCPEGVETCRQSEVKAAMLERFKREDKVETTIKGVSYAISELTAATQVAQDLGIDLPAEIQIATGIANAGLSSFVNFSTGNYMAALASVTGLFSKQNDPDAERFKVMMNYLQKQFEVVNLKLDKVLQNQVKIMEAINRLSKQMFDGFVLADKKISNIDFEIRQIGYSIRQQYWQSWSECNTVQVRALEAFGSSDPFVDTATLLFRSEKAVQEVIQSHDGNIQNCRTLMNSSFDSFLNQNRFGNFVDLRWVLNKVEIEIERVTASAARANQMETPSNGVQNESLETLKLDIRDPLQKFDNDVFKVSFRNIVNFATRDDTPGFAEIALVLAEPVQNIKAWQDIKQEGFASDFKCSEMQGPSASIRRALCPPYPNRPSAEVAASQLLSFPYLAPAINDIADWTLVMAQLVDRTLIVDGEAKWLTSDEIFKLAVEQKLTDGASNGELLVSSLLPVVDTVIASQGMLYGPMMAEIMLEKVLSGGDEAKSALIEMKSNGYLARNFAQVYLEHRYRERIPNRERPSLTGAQSAYELATDPSSPSTLLLEGYFGDDLGFHLSTDDQRPMFMLSAGDETLAFEVPPPFAMSEGLIVWPPVYQELIASREQLLDRLISYQVLDDLDGEKLVFMASMITRPAPNREDSAQ